MNIKPNQLESLQVYPEKHGMDFHTKFKLEEADVICSFCQEPINPNHYDEIEMGRHEECGEC